MANAHNEWVAVTLHVPQASTAPLLAALAAADAYAFLAPLDCIIPLADPHDVDEAVLAQLAPQRTIFRLPAHLAGDKHIQKKCQQWRDAGYRLILDGAEAGPVTAAQVDARALSFDASGPRPALHQLLPLAGPHLAYNIADAGQFVALQELGISWFAGDYALHHARQQSEPEDATSRRRLLALLGLLARDADAHELEVPLKQDPSLSYHLLKLVNSAAFGFTAPITSFSQAITLLGRRQLQRWLQLLLYARQQDDGKIHALLPLAAVRAAQMEALCQLRGGDRDAQDLAFMAGVFSLLDVLLGMPMEEIIATLNLAPEVSVALLERNGELGTLLALVESATPPPEGLRRAGIDGETYWRSLLQAYQWAIQVSRNL
ncbi:EAL and HDOD domain-containing protein [Janthinobacterium sp. GMG1]|uniref:EAL and HDOD domain-containing protein n=1 Tax=Janthinobacterium sp. GMG1 TaxID=3096007 RepID=UPI002ACA2293|nr:HDOD domain-containing protein [Janthinobacterium sp. GMG1]MDZ5636909.1 HDOD domain-containing protein [Janthinobacterium sp. GMG1]